MSGLSKTVVLVTGLAILLAAPAAAQLAGPVTGGGEFEAGFAYKYFHRDMEPNEPVEKEWEVATLYVRYGLSRKLTLTLEGGTWNPEHDDFPEMDYVRFTLGGGLGLGIAEVSGYLLSASFFYNEVFDLDRTPNAFHKNTRSYLFVLQAQRTIRLSRVDLTLWGGPSYAHDEGVHYLWGSLNPLEDESKNDFGVILGVNAVLFKRVDLGAQVLYADYWQPRVLIGVRL